jgi:hypothetical protein
MVSSPIATSQEANGSVRRRPSLLLPEDPSQEELAQYWTLSRAWRCWGLCRHRHLLHLKVHVRIPALKNGAQLPIQRSYARLQ